MPNGSDLTAQEYKQLDNLIRPVDSLIQSYAQKIGAEFRDGYHGLPDRSITWFGEDGIHRKIHFSPRFLDRELQVSKNPLCLVAMSAWSDTPQEVDMDFVLERSRVKRKLWHERLGSLDQSELNPKTLTEILEKAFSKLNNVGEPDLQ